MAKVCTADCGALEEVLGQRDVGKFKGTCCCGSKTPVFKKIPAFLFFLAIYLAIVINMGKALSAPTGQVAIFENVSDGFWRGDPFADWLPSATHKLSRSSYTQCRGICINTTNCKGFRLGKVSEYSSNDDCYIQTTDFDPNAVVSCSLACTSYIRSDSDPTPTDYSPGFNSPFTPENQGCTQPLSYGLNLCIIMATVVFVVYWCFFTLTVPARILFRLLFFATMIGSVTCGAFIVTWIINERNCKSNRYSFYSDFRTQSQIDLNNAAIAASVVLILMGAWPALFLPWASAGVIVHSILVGIYCLIMQADFGKIWTYFVLLEWLIWQDDEQLKVAGATVATPPAANVQHMGGVELRAKYQANQGANQGAHHQANNHSMVTVSRTVIDEYERTIAEEKATSASLRREVDRLKQELTAMSAAVKKSTQQAAPSSNYNAVPPPGAVPYNPAPYDPQYNPPYHPYSNPSPYGHPSPYNNPSPYNDNNNNSHNNPYSSPPVMSGPPAYEAYGPHNNYGDNSYGDNNKGQASSAERSPSPPAASSSAPSSADNVAEPSSSSYVPGYL